MRDYSGLMLVVMIGGGFVVGYLLISRVFDWIKKGRDRRTGGPPRTPADGAALAAAPGPGARLPGPAPGAQGGFAPLFGMLGMLATATGRLSREQLAVVNQFVQDSLRVSDPELRARLCDALADAAPSAQPFERHARDFLATHRNDPALLGQVLLLLREVAEAGGPVTPEQEQRIAEAATVFGLRGGRT